ncbi:fec operon regulator FecR [Kordia sp. SMS9]|uniref:FecR family protein n=1 Tax=Kordia sp. SMS9 TaxID=2282170 RepID=UPI000E0DB6C0|nr:FecR family protein [Kordia sp. SMS9]AXG68309.1 fec operon regulator FecR [Kordia sp. SMS9]
MKNYETDESFLGRWIAGELSEEERIAFEKTDAFRQFDVINKEAQLLDGPEIDVERALQIVKDKLASKPKKGKLIKLWQNISIAAILILSTGIFLTSTKTYTTGIGESQTITLADGSIINLNANSSVSHKRFFWSSHKTVALKGEAYFTITKGDNFRVATSKGTVAVLGTKFNIKDRTDFELKCYEGKIQFTQNNAAKNNYILTKGTQITITDDVLIEETFTEETPAWKKGVSTFTAKPLSEVLAELSLYFNLTFDATKIDATRLFSGSFYHSNLKNALKATLTPMGIRYKKVNSKITLFK